MALRFCGGRCVKSVLFSARLSPNNEVFSWPCYTLSSMLVVRRREGDVCPHRSLWSKVSCAKPFSTANLETGETETGCSRLYSLISVKVKGIDEAVLKSYTEFIIRAACHLGIDISGRIYLPTSIQRQTLIKSPHIYKKHRAQYEVRTHGRMLQARNLTGDTADVFLEYIQRNIPEGVSMSVEQTALEPLPKFFELPPEAETLQQALESNQGTEQTHNDHSVK